MKCIVVTLLLYSLSLHFPVAKDPCISRYVYFSGPKCIPDSTTYRKMISTDQNYLCDNVSFLGSTSKKNYFLKKDNQIIVYVSDNDISPAEIVIYDDDLRNYKVLRASVSENLILLEVVNDHGRRFVITLDSNSEGRKIHGEVFEIGNTNHTVCILMCDHFYAIKVQGSQVIQEHLQIIAYNQLESTEKILFDSGEEIATIDTTNSIIIKIKTKSGNNHHVKIDYPDKSAPSTSIKHEVINVTPRFAAVVKEESSRAVFNIQLTHAQITNIALWILGIAFVAVVIALVVVVIYYKRDKCKGQSPPTNASTLPTNTVDPHLSGSSSTRPTTAGNITAETEPFLQKPRATVNTQTEDATSHTSSLAPKP